jgi:hypothetical protein
MAAHIPLKCNLLYLKTQYVNKRQHLKTRKGSGNLWVVEDLIWRTLRFFFNRDSIKKIKSSLLNWRRDCSFSFISQFTEYQRFLTDTGLLRSLKINKKAAKACLGGPNKISTNLLPLLIERPVRTILRKPVSLIFSYLKHDVKNFPRSSWIMIMSKLRLLRHSRFDGELVGEGAEAGDWLSGLRGAVAPIWRSVGEQCSPGLFCPEMATNILSVFRSCCLVTTIFQFYIKVNSCSSYIFLIIIFYTLLMNNCVV